MYKFRGCSRGDRCHFLFGNGAKEVAFDIPWDEAAALIKQLTKVQRAAEEYAHANQIIGDSALLLRKGVPLGLTSDPKMLDEAAKEAAHNRDLRRYLPGGIKGKEQFGRPAIINHGVKANGSV